ncbi:DUF1156 domain-containing protein [Azospirillum argentinense]|uniref:DUF1156 domain-containing protein n=1 Tax=Azospirillum argentinense TaxID=2970906 RepID=A0ABW8V2Z2_9PROT
MDRKRLIEAVFPLAETSAASLHEKNMRHGHISTLHLWPARRPLAASRAAIAAALLPDPADDGMRAEAVRHLGGRLVVKSETKVDAEGKIEAAKKVAEGGILWWGNETGSAIGAFREKIRTAHGGHAPRVLDPFSGGGAIPLEAMRLGCDVTANDLNPVAWFLLKCTLEYPHRLADQQRPLPRFALGDRAFAEAFLKSKGYKGRRLARMVERMVAASDGSVTDDEASLPGIAEDAPWEAADLSWHVRAWGLWVSQEVRHKLANHYPIYAYFESSHPDARHAPRDPVLLEPTETGVVSVATLNDALSKEYLDDPRNPRWVAKPAAAYLWTRTVRCKACRAEMPLLKTRWLCRRKKKRVLLDMHPNPERTGVMFRVIRDVPMPTGTNAQKKAADQRVGQGTMSQTGARCPCCNGIMTMDDLQHEAREGRFGAVMTAVIEDGPKTKEYRDPTSADVQGATISAEELETLFSEIPFGRPDEPLSPHRPSPNTRGVSGLTRYGIDNWGKVFTDRQLLVLGTFAQTVRSVRAALAADAYDEDWQLAIASYLVLANDRIADYGSILCSWAVSGEFIRGTFVRFVLSIIWDYAEVNPLSGVSGGYLGAVEWIAKAVAHACDAAKGSPGIRTTIRSATEVDGEYDLIVTDPPYYDAIPYSDLMDFFHVWMRRTLYGMGDEFDRVFAAPTGPKWDAERADGELVDQPGRFGADRIASKTAYEQGMARAFRSFHAALAKDGILVLVFANKQPVAWEALVTALIRSGFVVDASWPIKTERAVRTNAIATASLSSSVWLVCRKRPPTAKPGWDGQVLEEMRARIRVQMRQIWDAGISGPDFVWAATGPALEAYSRHPVVFREAAATGSRETMPVAEFLREVRRLVVEFAVGRVLGDGTQADEAVGLDDVTTYYLLHRSSFGMAEAPIGACILYAISCGLSDQALTDQFEILKRAGRAGSVAEDEDEEEIEGDPEDGDDVPDDDDEAAQAGSGSGSKVRLRAWNERTRRNLGLEGVAGKPVPMIDRIHRLIRLWKTGDVTAVDAFLSQGALARDALFAQVVQALIELARQEGKADEAAVLESISNHAQARAGITAARQGALI